MSSTNNPPLNPTNYSNEIDELTYTNNGYEWKIVDQLPPEGVEVLKSAIHSLIQKARIEERDFAWKLINDVRYQRETLDSARDITLDRLSTAQVEAELNHNDKER